MPGNQKNECLKNNIKTPLPTFLPGIDEGKLLIKLLREVSDGFDERKLVFELICGSNGWS